MSHVDRAPKKNPTIQAFAEIARVPKPQKRNQVPECSINTKLGYQITAIMVLFLVLIPGLFQGAQAVSEYFALAEKRSEYEVVFDKRNMLLNQLETETGITMGMDSEPVTDLDTADEIARAIQIEESRIEQIEQQRSLAERQKKAQSEGRINTYIQTWQTYQIQKGSGLSDYAKQRVESLKKAMTEEELAEAEKRISNF